MVEERPDVIVVDDEESMRSFLEIVLVNEGLSVEAFDNGEAAVRRAREARPRVVIQDLRMGGLDGMDLLAEFKKIDAALPVIVITAYSTWDTAVEAMRVGAFDYLRKPFDTDHIRSVIRRAITVEPEDDPWSKSQRLIIGNTPPMQRVYDLIARVSTTDSTILVRGESGTGKELVARAIHSASHRRRQPFVAVNCSAFAEGLLESELFGHVRGAFTGATDDRKGLFASADGGTLFLDEVADMSSSTQVRILRALEERRVMPVGGSEESPVDVRIIAATNRDIEQMIADGEFREDLFYRLNVIPIFLPALRERCEDIPLLAGHFLAKYAKAMNRSVERLSESAQRTLMAYEWPGNVRELDNVIQRHVALCDGEVVERIDVSSAEITAPAQPTAPVAQESDSFDVPEQGFDLDQVLQDVERRYLIRALEKTGGNLTKAAKILGLTYRSIRYKVQKLGVRDTVGRD